MSEIFSGAVLDPAQGEAPAAMSTATSAPTASLQRTLVGRVVSNKMNKTVTVLIERRVKHPLYGKFMVRSKKYHAHDETDQYNEGDMVEIAETRPVSRTKAWTVTRLIEAARVI